MNNIWKKVLACISVALLGATAFFSACYFDEGEFVWDNLGGGGIGTESEKIDTTGLDASTKEAAERDSETLSDLSGDTDSSGSTQAPADLVISAAGDYTLSGNYPNGVQVSAKKGSEVHLFLNNANINCESGKALYSDNNITTIITVVAGTTNTIRNAGDDVNAVHFKGNLSINGTGKLSITSDSKSAIKASGTLQIVDSDITVKSASHGLTAQSVSAKNCKITVTSSGKDGIQAESSDYKTKDESGNTVYAYTMSDGYVFLENVVYNAVTKGDGIQADTYVFIDRGTYNITTEGEWVSYSTANKNEYGLTDDDYRWTLSGTTYSKVASDEINRYGISRLYSFKQGCKGIKVGELEYEVTENNVTRTVAITNGDYNIKIQNGSFKINSSDDAIHANSGDIAINGGTFVINTIDDAITADNLTKINGGTVEIQSSYEGIEGTYVEINGGTITVNASDDGINAANDDPAITEHIIITGGDIYVNSTGDGIDSNGSMQITGGNIVVHGPTSGMDAALDADKGILLDGGSIFACGSSGMVETPSSNSKQYVMVIKASSSVSANTKISLTDKSGKEIMSETTEKACQSIIMSSPDIKKGETYTVKAGNTTLGSVTVSSILSSIGQSSGGGGWGRR